jgi:outer membrane lipoprotein SlyB
MEFVTSQSGSTRVSPLVIAVVASATIAGLVAIGSMTGMLPGKRLQVRSDEPLPRVESKTLQQSSCALCGTIESVRTVEVYDEPSAAAGVTDSKGGGETAGAGSGGASAGGATSVLDSLNDIVSGSATEKPEKNLRRRLVWRVTVRMDDGSFRAISLPRPPGFAVGEKVRVVEGRLARA